MDGHMHQARLYAYGHPFLSIGGISDAWGCRLIPICSLDMKGRGNRREFGLFNACILYAIASSF